MATEAKRKCGFRKLGGLYMVADGPGEPCDRLPILLTVCPCCGAGIKFSRGFTWIDPGKLFNGDHGNFCTCPLTCPACYPSRYFGDGTKAGLMWIGEKFYSVEEFMTEVRDQGFSKRIASIPRGFKVGETWVFLAHIKAASVKAENPEEGLLFEQVPGIFMAIQPRGFEKIVTQTAMDNHKLVKEWPEHPEEYGIQEPQWDQKVKEDYDEIQGLIDRGIKPVPVPDNDTDHNPNGNGSEE